MAARVRVTGLEVRALTADAKAPPLVGGLDLHVDAGEVLALIGESGSGKTTTALALMGHARPGCAITGGRITVGDTEVLGLSPHGLRAYRGRRAAYVAQSAAAAFNPSLKVIDQVIEPALIHGLTGRAAAEAAAISLFAELGLPDPSGIGRRYPHQLSGGQLQRMMAAMALITDPELVILDEPTTALDVTTQVEVLRTFKRVLAARGASALYVSHDLAVVAQMADRVAVLRGGRLVESGSCADILRGPVSEYGRALVKAAGRRGGSVTRAGSTPETPFTPPALLEIRGVSAVYGRGATARPVLSDIDLTIPAGGRLGVVGESGSGKSTLARVICGLVAPAAGTLTFGGKPLAATCAGRDREALRRIQIVFQNADTALNPAHTVADCLERPLSFYHGLRGGARRRGALELLDRLKLPASLADRRCAGLSGGQKQRVNLARALAAQPDLLICDEVTSALDPLVAEATLALMSELQRDLGLAVMFISHDLAVVRGFCDRVAVLYAGCKVEESPAATLGEGARHPYGELLRRSTPLMRQGWLETAPSAGEARAVQDRDLCPFLDRCPTAVGGLCDRVPPPRIELDDRTLLCHRPTLV